MEFIFFWALFGIIIALIARSKGRSGAGWFFYGLLLWPVALVHVLVATRTPESERRRAMEEGRIPCPHCAEMVKREARICPHCRFQIGQPASS